MRKKKESRVFNVGVLIVVSIIVALEGFLVATAVAGQPSTTFIAAADAALGHAWQNILPGR